MNDPSDDPKDESVHGPHNHVNLPPSNGKPTNSDADQVDDENDPFSLDRLRLSQDFRSMANVRKVITTVPCRKPNRYDFVRVHPGEGYRMETIIFEDKMNRDVYLVDPELREELANESFAACLLTAITKQGNVFLWQVRLPGEDGRSNSWNDSALAASRIAERSWVRMSANMSAGSYDTHEAVGDLGEPNWPDSSFQELLRICFKDRFIQDRDHPVLRELRGEN